MIDVVRRNLEEFWEKESFVINDVSYSYGQFAQKISNIRRLICDNPMHRNEIVGVVTYNDIETYATIYALWFEGLCFLPINPRLPVIRNQAAINQTDLRYVFSSKNIIEGLVYSEKLQFHSTGNLQDQSINISLPKLNDTDLMYVLFTSGSTGVPKGVPINRKNLNAFVTGFLSNGYEMSENDRFLQMFDFTFDISVQCYVLPLYIGASVHTIPLDDIKFFTIYQIMEKYRITVAKLVPSVVAFLRPYFSKIHLPHLRYSLFSGEALYNDTVGEWAQCVPNAIIQNYYGPTEATIDCLFYTWDNKKVKDKTYNGVVSIGKPFGDTKAIVLADDNSVITDYNKKGELCVSGSQVTTGYLNLPERNKTAFVRLNYLNETRLFYRTGDLVYIDCDGDYMFCGRIDHQVQVQGYRVELGELESQAKEVAGNIQVAAIAKEKSPGNIQLYLFLENYKQDSDLIYNNIKRSLPFYMHPAKIFILEKFPLTSSGKIDRNSLSELI